MRMRWPRPDQPRKYRLPPPRLPPSGQSVFWQQKCSIGCCWSADMVQPLAHTRLGDFSLLPYSTHHCVSSADTTVFFCFWSLAFWRILWTEVWAPDCLALGLCGRGFLFLTFRRFLSR